MIARTCKQPESFIDCRKFLLITATTQEESFIDYKTSMTTYQDPRVGGN
jgi:hypothetical protein